MNIEIQRIKHAFKMECNGSPWHGTSLRGLLKGVDYLQARQRIFPGTHSIWELVQHIYNWREFVVKKMEGDSEFDIELNTIHDWANIQVSTEESWQKLLSQLADNQQTIVEILGGWLDDQLDDQVPGKDYTYYTLLHGMIKHDIYHAGQIAMTRKMLTIGG
ncbi:DinB family protein [uncultured Microscilla sp.]|uniref:DinB family protein n=1 Tax=uncultured Microscilla sp. TaxID=432653 RepID=UPI0026330EE1|nr:DinB family protein [uncultured Microscilla sp.]